MLGARELSFAVVALRISFKLPRGEIKQDFVFFTVAVVLFVAMASVFCTHLVGVFCYSTVWIHVCYLHICYYLYEFPWNCFKWEAALFSDLLLSLVLTVKLSCCFWFLLCFVLCFLFFSIEVFQEGLLKDTSFEDPDLQPLSSRPQTTILLARAPGTVKWDFHGCQ